MSNTPYALFITRNDLIKQTPLQGSIDSDRLINFVRTSQEKYILNLLGTVLYYKLQADIVAQTPFTGRYAELMNNHIKPTLIWATMVEYLPFSAVQFKSEGAVKHESEQSKAVSKTEIDYLLQKASDNMEYYSTRMQDFLIAYSNEIPEYLESVGNTTQIYPDMRNQYFSGINL
jgi:hypothetical protein